MAAHAACADAALADDRHWDAVAASQPESDVADAPTGPDRQDVPARKAGCLAIAVVVLVGVVLFGRGGKRLAA
jgi:hypothetical protein